MTTTEEKITYADPPKIFSEKPSIKKYLRYLKFFGPGAIVASLTLGQGQLILGPQIGALTGFSLLWLITINIGSYLIAYVSCRFMMISGIEIVDLFAIKTKKGWFNWILIAIMLIFIPIFAASIITSLGQSLAWIFGIGHYLIWGISFSIGAAVLVVIGRYRLLEYTQAIFVAVLAIGAIVSILFIQPNFLEIIPNFFTIGQNVPDVYPSWIEQIPDYNPTPIPLLMLGYLGTLTFTLITLVGYLGWIKEKKWGIFKNRKDSNVFSNKLFKSFKEKGKISYLPTSNSERNKIKLLLKPLKIDLSIAFIIVAIVSASYMIAGSSLLGLQSDGSVLLPSDLNLIKEQGRIFSYMASWLKPLFQISVFFALFGTIYAGLEAATRMLYETMKSLNDKVKDFAYRRFMIYVIMFILVTGIPLSILMYKGLSVLLMLSITLMFIGVFGVIIYGISALYLSQKVLPKTFRLSKSSLIIVIIGIILLCIPLLFLFI
jgi:Mn2+/Fe2+ NRAMP family transporter